jgi:hypothetical protein
MSQEQVEILKMVADKVISVEEGERLLRALEESHRQQGGGWHHHHGRHGHGWFARVGEVFGDVGAMVQDAVEEAIGEGGSDFEPDDERFAEVDLGGSRLAVPSGTTLLVRHRPLAELGARRGDVELRGVAGDSCAVAGPEKAGVRVFRADGRLAVAFARGPVRIEVPETVSSLKVATAGGDIAAVALGCPVELKTMGGNIALEGVTREVKAKTVGGNLRVALAPGLTGESRVVTMGGNIDLLVPEGVKVMVRAATIGEIKVDPALGAVRRGTDFVIGKAILDIGGAGDEPSVRLKSLGGTIRVSRGS